MQKLINALNKKVNRFISLCERSKQQQPSYHDLLACYFSVIAVIAKLENKLPRSELVTLITPVRETLRLSPFFKRAQDWPRGYQGDFETIEYLLTASNHARNNSLAYHIEYYALNTPAATQHRNKIQHQSRLILKTSLAISNPSILSIACGGCPDLVEVQDFVNKGALFTLFDLDKDALAFAEQKLTKISDRCKFVQGNAAMLERYFRHSKPFDLVLIGGLFDYLNDKTIIRVLRFVFLKLLNPGGMIFFSNISPDNIDRIEMEYFGEWHLIARDEQAVLSLCDSSGIPIDAVKIFRDKTQCTVMVEISK